MLPLNQSHDCQNKSYGVRCFVVFLIYMLVIYTILTLTITKNGAFVLTKISMAYVTGFQDPPEV